MNLLVGFNEYSEKKTDFEEFSSKSLAEKYPPAEIFMLKETQIGFMLFE